LATPPSSRALPGLPPPPGDLLLVGPQPGTLERDLAAAGYAVRVAEGLGGSPALEAVPAASQDAVVLLAAGTRDLIAAGRRALKEKGRLLLAGPGVGADARETVVALAEAGFVILQAPPAAETWAARKESFFVRAYRDGDEERILPMFARNFHVERSLARWRWEYRENPYGTLRISEAFAEDGRLVAHYAGYPVCFHHAAGGEPRRLPALQIGDTMTDPAFRHVGRGPTSLLGRTVRHYYARFCEGRVAFNYGFNTGNIQRFSMSFVGARRLESLPFHVLDLARRPLAPPDRLRSWLAGYRTERIAGFDGRWDRFFQRVSGAYRLLVERDARYLEWRYARCPDTEYFRYAVFRRGRLAGWSVFRRKEERLLWGDALFDPRHPSAVRQLLATVLAAPEHRQARTIETWVTPRPAWWAERVLELGFEPRPEPDDLGFVFVPFGHDPEEDFRAHLYYTMGDSDLF
jgi:hypothetical protein